MMNIPSRPTEPWQPCPAGTLRSFGSRTRNRRRLQRGTQTAAAAVLLATVGLTAWSVYRPVGQRDGDFGGIACTEVHANIDAYMQGRLPADLADRIRIHLGKCPDCQAAMKKMKMGTASHTSGEGRLAACKCAHCRETPRTAWFGAARSRQASRGRMVAFAP